MTFHWTHGCETLPVKQRHSDSGERSTFGTDPGRSPQKYLDTKDALQAGRDWLATVWPSTVWPAMDDGRRCPR